MKVKKLLLGSLLVFFSSPYFLLANPYPDPDGVPKDPPFKPQPVYLPSADTDIWDDAVDALRIEVEWREDESYLLKDAVIEKSGTPALVARSRQKPSLGSFHGMLVDPESKEPFFFDSIGTGTFYRKLTRALTFRFPTPTSPALFVLQAEDLQTGELKTVLEKRIDPKNVKDRRLDGVSAFHSGDIEVRVVQAASLAPKLIMNIYAEGYKESARESFWQSAQRVLDSLERIDFPLLKHLEIRGVFKASTVELGAPRELGTPIPDHPSFLSLFYPYWMKEGRWYNVVYPTRESRYRDGIGLAPYDYPLVLINDSHYWGVGNFNELTAIPSDNGSFSYLLYHEFGHFFGLNEEYEGGGPTELEFAPGTVEPWSQNLTFLPDGNTVKWDQFVREGTLIPTPESDWEEGNYGAYKGGYGDSNPQKSHKPGFACIMNTGSRFCPICSHGIETKMRFDMGLVNLDALPHRHP